MIIIINHHQRHSQKAKIKPEFSYIDPSLFTFPEAIALSPRINLIIKINLLGDKKSRHHDMSHCPKLN